MCDGAVAPVTEIGNARSQNTRHFATKNTENTKKKTKEDTNEDRPAGGQRRPGGRLAYGEGHAVIGVDAHDLARHGRRRALKARARAVMLA